MTLTPGTSCDDNRYCRVIISGNIFGQPKVLLAGKAGKRWQAGNNIYEHIVTRLPYKLRYEKRKITKLLKIRDQIPCIGGKGGDIEFLNWFTNNIINNTFSIIFSACVVFGSNKIKSKLKNKNIKKLIKKKIIKESVNWDDITLDELVENFTIPKDYKGSKEELIEEIVYEKAIQYKEKIIEKIRNT